MFHASRTRGFQTEDKQLEGEVKRSTKDVRSSPLLTSAQIGPLDRATYSRLKTILLFGRIFSNRQSF